MSESDFTRWKKNRREAPKQYVRVAPFRSLVNMENESSVYSRRYSNLKQSLVMGVGRVFLAENERTVILTMEAEQSKAQHNVSSDVILSRVNEQLKRGRLSANKVVLTQWRELGTCTG